MVDDKVNERLESILERYIRSPEKIRYRFLYKVLNYYESCQHMSNQDYDYYTYIQWLERHAGISFYSYSVGDNDWLDLYGRLVKYGLNNVYWEYELKNNEIIIRKPKDFGEFTGDTNIQESRHGMEEMKTFEKKWKKIYNETRVDETSDLPVPLSEVDLPWIKDFLRTAFKKTKINENTLIRIQNRTYLKNLWNFLNTYKDDWVPKNYVFLRFKNVFLYSNIYKEVPTTFTKNECIKNTRKNLPLAMNWIYENDMDKQLVAQKQKDLREIFGRLRNKFFQITNKNRDNFTDEILQSLLKKIQNLRLEISNIPEENTIEIIEKYYEDLYFDSDEFHYNILKLLKFKTQENFGFLNEKSDTHFGNFSNFKSCGPYYRPKENMIFVPLSLLKMNIFHNDSENFLKYSSIGFILAREIGYACEEVVLGFDDEHRIIGPSELIKNQRFIDNYKRMSEDQPEIFAEKFADKIGLLLAYKTGIVDSGRSNYDRKLFFSNFAINFCGNEDNGSDKKRLNYALSNFAQFAKDYNCPRGSLMNPAR